MSQCYSSVSPCWTPDCYTPSTCSPYPDHDERAVGGCCMDSYCDTSSSCCTPDSKIADFAKGNGTFARMPMRPAVPLCCPPPVAKIRPRIPGADESCVPAYISDYPRRNRRSDPECCKSPGERLRNVDVHEELCYMAPAGECICAYCSCPPQCCCCPCPCFQRQEPPNPVRYNRRQRFTFDGSCVKVNDFQNGPPWPFDRVSCQPCCVPMTYQTTSYPPPQRQEDPPPVHKKCSSSSDLPEESGNYYYSASKKCFVPYCPPPQPDIYIVPCEPPPEPPAPVNPPDPPVYSSAPGDTSNVQEFEVLEEISERCPEREVVIQPIIQPMFLTDNGCGSNKSHFSSNNNTNCVNQTTCCPPATVPMCIPMCPPQQSGGGMAMLPLLTALLGCRTYGKKKKGSDYESGSSGGSTPASAASSTATEATEKSESNE